MLQIDNVYKSFGALRALDGVTVKIDKEISGLIGPNGSGKSTLFNCISGFYKIDKGKIYFSDEKINGLEPHKIAKKGVMRNFQVCKSPQKLTVFQNLLLATNDQNGEKLLSNFFARKKTKEEEKENIKKAEKILSLIQLTEHKNEYAANLSGGQQKLLSIGRMLMAEPNLILLDEPTAGVNPTLTKELLKTIKNVSVQKQVSFFIIEHNMSVIDKLCEEVFVLDAGKLIAQGTPQEIRENKDVLEAYLTREASC